MTVFYQFKGIDYRLASSSGKEVTTELPFSSISKPSPCLLLFLTPPVFDTSQGWCGSQRKVLHNTYPELASHSVGP